MAIPSSLYRGNHRPRRLRLHARLAVVRLRPGDFDFRKIRVDVRASSTHAEIKRSAQAIGWSTNYGGQPIEGSIADSRLPRCQRQGTRA